MAKEHKKSRNLGLWIPQGIVNMRMLTGDEKLLYAYVYSFGERGCWQTDEQIAKALGRSDRTIRRYLANCKKAGLFKVSGARSKYRRMWAEANPKFKLAQRLWAEEHGQNCPSRRTNPSFLHGQNCPDTKTITNKTTIKERGGSPSPAEQAHAPLKDKQQQLEAYRTKEEAIASIRQLNRSFGRGVRRQTPAECEKRRQEQKRALLAVGAE